MPAKRAVAQLTVAMLAQAPGVFVFDRLSVGQRATRHSHTRRLIGFHQVDPGVMGLPSLPRWIVLEPPSLFPTFYVAMLTLLFGLHHTRHAHMSQIAAPDCRL